MSRPAGHIAEQTDQKLTIVLLPIRQPGWTRSLKNSRPRPRRSLALRQLSVQSKWLRAHPGIATSNPLRSDRNGDSRTPCGRIHDISISPLALGGGRLARKHPR